MALSLSPSEIVSGQATTVEIKWHFYVDTPRELLQVTCTAADDSNPFGTYIISPQEPSEVKKMDRWGEGVGRRKGEEVRRRKGSRYRAAATAAAAAADDDG
jgi:hypothetical protein